VPGSRRNWVATGYGAADCGRAERFVQQALALDDTTAAALTHKELLYQEAVALCPTHAQAQNNLGYVYEKQGRFDEAIAAYQKTIKLDPSAPYPYFGLGDVYFKTGRYADALQWYEQGLKYEPENELSQQLVAQIRVRSRSDSYFLFFRPLQDCYVYVLQEDVAGTLDILFPHKPAEAFVRQGQDYWLPAFGKGYTLDDTVGEEKLSLIATSWSLTQDIEGFSDAEQIQGAVRSLKTRAIYVKRPTEAAQTISVQDFNQQTERIAPLLERIEGRGAWVKMVTFRHE